MQYAADREAADVARRVEVRDERLERVVVLGRGWRDPLEEQVEQRPEVGPLLVEVHGGGALAGHAVDDGEVELVERGVEVEEQLLDLVDDLADARVGPVDLVDHEDGGKAELERLAQDEPGLGERPLGRVHQQQHAVDHVQRPLDLATEVGVAGRVDDVDLRVAVADGRVLGQDRDALLALEVGRVEDPIGELGALAEGAGLSQHAVDQRGLAVVDVGDDGDVADAFDRAGRGRVDEGGV